MDSTRARRIVLVCMLGTACGGGIDKGPKKVVSNTSNSTTANNTTANNTTSNNTTSNNTTSNNTTANNTTSTNGVPCVGIAPASLNFGQVRLSQSAQASVTLENCSPNAPLTLNSVTAPQGFTVLMPSFMELAPSTTGNLVVEFTPPAAGDFVGQVSLDTSAGTAVVNVQGEGLDPVEACPTAVAQGRAVATDPWTANVNALTQSTVQLTGANSTGQSAIVGYEWTLVSRPAASTARLTPSASVASPSLFVDVAGAYELDLRVTTANSPQNCPAARMRVDAGDTVDPNAITVELVWDTPGDADQTDQFGSDMDLHYLHPQGSWNVTPYDCHWLNPDANWAADGEASVELDDTDGTGPENIRHSNASALTFQVGVYYFQENGYGLSTATIRVSRAGVLMGEQGGVTLQNTGDFWLAADFDAGTNIFTGHTAVADGFPP